MEDKSKIVGWKIREKAYNIFLDSKKIHYALEKFSWTAVTPTKEQLELLEKAVGALDVKLVKKLLREFGQESLDCWSTTELKALAKKKKILNYSRLTKEQLVVRLKRYEKN